MYTKYFGGDLSSASNFMASLVAPPPRGGSLDSSFRAIVADFCSKASTDGYFFPDHFFPSKADSLLFHSSVGQAILGAP